VEEAVGVLWSLAANNADSQADIAAAGGIRPLVDLLRCSEGSGTSLMDLLRYCPGGPSTASTDATKEKATRILLALAHASVENRIAIAIANPPPAYASMFVQLRAEAVANAKSHTGPVWLLGAAGVLALGVAAIVKNRPTTRADEPTTPDML
jgi:hypothetical protein